MDRFKEISDVLFSKSQYMSSIFFFSKSRFTFDLSKIKNDGGGTQYTFLEAIYQDCALVLHKEWVDQGDTFKDKYNCYFYNFDKNKLEKLKVLDILKLIKGEILENRYKKNSVNIFFISKNKKLYR